MSVLKPSPDNIPDELKAHPQWVVWKLEQRAQDGEPTKPPYCARNGAPNRGCRCSITNPNNWATFQDALREYRWGLQPGGPGYTGIGFVFGPDDPYAGVDLDDCRDPETGELTSEAQALVDRLDTYTEVSPSGTGVKVIARVTKKAVLATGTATNHKEGQPAVYTQGRYFTLTGQVLPGHTTIEERQEQFEDLAPKQPNPAEQAGVTTAQSAVEAGALVVKAVWNRLSARAQALLKGTAKVTDRSAASAELAHLCVEAGLTDAEVIAHLVMAAPSHQEKFGSRVGGHDAWTDALACAVKALEAHQQAPTEGGGTAQTLALPDECYVGLPGEFADLLAASYEAPKEYWFFVYLSLLGSCLADSVTLDEDSTQRPQLYTVLLGESGREKKSTAIKRGMRHFEEAFGGAESLPFKVVNGAGSGEGLAEFMKPPKGTTETKPTQLVADELRGLLTKAQIRNSSLGNMLATLFEHTVFENPTKGGHVSVKNARLGLIAACTSESYALVWDGTLIAMGLPNRLLVVPGRATNQISVIDALPAGKEMALQKRLAEILDAVSRKRLAQGSYIRLYGGQETFVPDPSAPLRLKFTPEARELWDAWYDSKPQGVHGIRLDTIGKRLAVVLSVAQGNIEAVGEATINTVCRILDWQYEVRMAYDPVDADSTIARLEESIRRQLNARGPLTRRELRQYTHADRYGLWSFDAAVKNLQSNGDLAVGGKKYWLITGEQ